MYVSASVSEHGRSPVRQTAFQALCSVRLSVVPAAVVFLAALGIGAGGRITAAHAQAAGDSTPQTPPTEGLTSEPTGGESLAPVGTASSEDLMTETPGTFLDEVKLTGYVENSGVLNLGDSGEGGVNELRFYDFEDEVSFNMAELALKKDPSDAYPLGFGLVVTGGRDAQKNHALGLFREVEDVFPFEDTAEFDLQEVYGSYRLPVGKGLTLKAGKFVTLLGSEVIEGPLNLNVSRSLLFVYSIPLTHVGALASYPVGERVSLTAGPVLGWDVLDDNNDRLSWMGQVAVTPAENLATNLQLIVGPEQLDNDPVRWVADLVVNYTGIERLTLGLNGDYGHEDDEASLVAASAAGGNGESPTGVTGASLTGEAGVTPPGGSGASPIADSDASWWGLAGYAAYDWTAKFRTAGRLEYFDDSDGVRTLALGAGEPVSLWELTATAQYNIWNGLFGRLEYRHDGADREVFDLDGAGVPTSETQDTVTLAVYYAFF
jgi:hypothetical protein